MPKTTAKKLTLNKEVLKALSDIEMTGAIGGVYLPTTGVEYTCACSAKACPPIMLK
jgi:hypothetical protein